MRWNIATSKQLACLRIVQLPRLGRVGFQSPLDRLDQCTKRTCWFFNIFDDLFECSDYNSFYNRMCIYFAQMATAPDLEPLEPLDRGPGNFTMNQRCWNIESFAACGLKLPCRHCNEMIVLSRYSPISGRQYFAAWVSKMDQNGSNHSLRNAIQLQHHYVRLKSAGSSQKATNNLGRRYWIVEKRDQYLKEELRK